MAVGALIGFSALVVLAFGLRTVLHRRQTGRSGWLMSPTPSARVGDGLFVVGVIGTLLAPTLQLFGVPTSPDLARAVPMSAAGILLLVVGSVIALVAQAQLGTAWRAGIDLSADAPLVTSGLFGIVRNPFYLGFITASAGVALMVPGVVSVAGLIALVAGCEIDVRTVEEPHLRSVQGADYTDYVARTPRFVPTIRSLTTCGR